MYKVIKDFSDLKDNGYVYLTGDTYPREGVKASEKRVAELASADNRRGEALISLQKPEISPITAEKEAKEELVKKEKKPVKKKNNKEKK